MRSKSRLDLNAYLRTLCPNVYFQPPENVDVPVPSIVYNVSQTGQNTYANDKPYIISNEYDITCTSNNPDWDVPDKLANGPYMAMLEQFYNDDNLSHWKLSIR